MSKTMDRNAAVDNKRIFYKFTEKDAQCIYGLGGYFQPQGDRPGKWNPRRSKPEICASGYHVGKGWETLKYITGHLYVAEVRGSSVEGAGKLSFEQMRLLRRVDAWDRRAAVLFVLDCAERLLPAYERLKPADAGPREVLAEARREVLKGWIGPQWDRSRLSWLMESCVKCAGRTDPEVHAAMFGRRRTCYAAAEALSLVLDWDSDAPQPAMVRCGERSRGFSRYSVSAVFVVGGGLKPPGPLPAGVLRAIRRGEAAERLWQLRRFLKYAEGKADFHSPRITASAGRLT